MIENEQEVIDYLKKEENKEKIRQQEKITDNIFNKLNSRAGLIPYFNIILDDSKIKENDGKIV